MAKIGTINKIRRCVMRNASIFIFVILVGLIGSTIQAGELINYQGRLTDSDGNPVPDSTYQLTFSLYDDSTGGFLQWSEVHPSVQTNDGLFCVILGSVDNNLDASIFETEPLYLEIQVGVEVISPRTRLTSAPNAITAKNMFGGDIETGPSSLVVKSATGDTGIIIGAATDKNSIMQVVLNNLEGDPIGPMVEMTSNPMASSGILIHAAQPTFSGRIALTAHQSDSSEIVMYREGAVPHDEKRALGMRTSSNATFLTMYNPDMDYPDQALVEMRSQSSGGSIEFFPAGDLPNNPAVRMGTGPSPFNTGRLEFFDPTGSLPHDPYVRMGFEPSPFAGGRLEFFDPGSGWPNDPMIVMGTEPSPFHAASFRMYNPVPVPPPKLVEIAINDSTGEWGSRFSMYTIDAGDDEKEILSITSAPSTGASIRMATPLPEPPARIMEMSINESGGEWENKIKMFLVHPPEYPTAKEILSIGSAPSTGASFKMFNPQPEPPARLAEWNVKEVDAEWGTSFSMYLIDPSDDKQVLEMRAFPSTGVSIKMFNPQPEPPAVVAEMAGSYDGKGGTGQVAVYDDANHLQSVLIPAKLVLNYAFGDNFGPPVFMEASASQAKVGIGTYTPSEPLVVGNDLGTFGGDWIVIGNSEAGQMSGFLAGEDIDNHGWMGWHNDGNYLTFGTEDDDSAYWNTLVLKAGKVGIGTNSPTEELHVVGDICYTGSIGACSDRRYKKDIQTIGDAAETLLKLRGISYSWRQDEYPDMKFDDQTHLGFVAQEIKDLVPGAVLVDDNGNMSVDYGRITPLLVEAVKEQQDQIIQLNAQITDLREALQKLQATNR